MPRPQNVSRSKYFPDSGGTPYCDPERIFNSAVKTYDKWFEPIRDPSQCFMREEAIFVIVQMPQRHQPRPLNFPRGRTVECGRAEPDCAVPAC